MYSESVLSSTEDNIESSKQEDSDSEEQERGADPRSAAASSQPQRVALFPGMDPSALMVRLPRSVMFSLILLWKMLLICFPAGFSLCLAGPAQEEKWLWQSDWGTRHFFLPVIPFS